RAAARSCRARPSAAGRRSGAPRANRSSTYPPSTELRRKERAMSDNTETAILAGGCFWGVQELLRRRDGVISTRVGYTGGENENPTYPNHPGHAEAGDM